MDSSDDPPSGNRDLTDEQRQELQSMGFDLDHQVPLGDPDEGFIQYVTDGLPQGVWDKYKS